MNLTGIVAVAEGGLPSAAGSALRVAIQGEPGSNSHRAAREMVPGCEVVACAVSGDVFAAVVGGGADAAVLPIENSLHGSVAEHYDLLLTQPVRIDAERSVRIGHNLIAAPGVKLDQVRRVLSHPVALSQCRRFLGEMAARGVEVLPFYDTAGSVKHVMAEGLRETAGVAPLLAAEVYGAAVLAEEIEDHPENWTRFFLLRKSGDAALVTGAEDAGEADKMSVAFALEHRPGTLVAALGGLAAAGVDLTKIESRPVVGTPWEYVFYVDFRFQGKAMAEAALAALRTQSGMVKELGRYRGSC